MNAFLFDARSPKRRRLSLRPERNHYAERLAAVLGNGAEWEYRGHCLDLGYPGGSCACGHCGLRYLFTLHHKKSQRTVIVGSVCVENFPGISGHLVASVAADCQRLQLASVSAERSRLLGPQTLFSTGD